MLKRVKRENVVAGQEREEKSRLEKKRSSFFFKKKSSRRRPLASDAPSRSFRPRSRPRASRSWSRARRNRGAGSTPPGNRVEPPRRVEGVRCRRPRRTPVRTWLRNILLTSCLVTMPTARSAAGSTTTTHPIFSFTRDVTTLDSLSSGMAVTHFAAGIMKLATDGMFSRTRECPVLFGVRAGRAVCSAEHGRSASRRRFRAPLPESEDSASSDDRRDRRRAATRLSARPVRAFRLQTQVDNESSSAQRATFSRS